MLFRRDRERTGQLDAKGRPIAGSYDDESDAEHTGFHSAHALGWADAFEIDVEAYGLALDESGEPLAPADLETVMDTSDYGHPRVYRRYTRRRDAP